MRLMLIVFVLLVAGCTPNNQDFERFDTFLDGPVYSWEWKAYCEEHPDAIHRQCVRLRGR